MAYDYPPLRKALLPTLAQALKQIELADKREERARDTRPLMAILEQLEIADPRLAGHIRARTAALLGFPWKIVPRSKDADQAEKDKAAAAEQRLFEGINQYMMRYLDTELYGVSLAKVNWTLDGQWYTTGVEHYDASDLEALPNQTEIYPGGVAILEQAGSSRFERKAAQSEIGGGLATTYIAGTSGRKVGGALRSIMILELLLNMNLQWWSNFNRALRGLKVAKTRAGAAGEDIATAKQAIEELGITGGAVVSDDVMFEFVKMVDSLGASSYEAFEEAVHKKVSILLRGAANVSDLPERGGSRAAVEVQRLVEIDILFMDMIHLARRINAQLLRQDFALNINQVVPRVLPYEFKMMTDEQTDYESNARQLETITRSGYAPDLEEVRSKTGWETLELKPGGGVDPFAPRDPF